MKNRLLMIDGNAMAYQSYYAFRRAALTSPGGAPVGALYGFIRKMLWVTGKYMPTHVIAAFDSKGKTDNHMLYEEYKSNRKPMPAELAEQLKLIRSFLEAADIPVVMRQGVEADDILGTLAEKAKNEKDTEVYIYSPDKDLLQLIDHNVFIVKGGAKEDVLFDGGKFLETYGFSHEYMADFLAITGDASDNVPGVGGVGKVNARKAVLSGGSVEEILKDCSILKNPRVQAAVERDREQLILSKQLVTINRGVEIGLDLDSCQFPSYSREHLEGFFREYGFLSLLKEMGFQTVKKKIKFTRPSIIPGSSYVIGTFSQENQAFNLETGDFSLVENMDDYLMEKEITLWIYDSPSLIRRKEEMIKCRLKDLRLLEYWVEYSDASADFKMFAKKRNIDDIRDLSEYFLKSREKAEKEGWWDTIISGDRGFSQLLHMMEKNGVMVNTELLDKYEDELAEKVRQGEREIHEAAGVEFNVNSPKQLGEVLFETMGITLPGRLKKSKSGYVTDEQVMNRVKKVHPVGQMVLDYRKVKKMLSTYVLPFRDFMDREGRVHSDFDYCGTATGRISSKNPNLQNIPVHGEWGDKLRDMVVAPEGWSLISADYSQMELRILAHFSGDEKLLQIFRDKGDIHAETASHMFGKTDAELRSSAKTINFGIMYGQSPYSLAMQLGIPVKQAEDYIRLYFDRFSGVKRYMDRCLREAREKGYVEVISGRRRRVEGLASSNRNIREGAERIAINTPVQGSAADIIKGVMLNMKKELDEKDHVSMVLQIHDELLFEVRDEQIEETAVMVKSLMEDVPYQMDLEMVVETGAGKTWREAH